MINFKCIKCGKNINDQVEFGTATVADFDGDFICFECNKNKEELK